MDVIIGIYLGNFYSSINYIEIILNEVLENITLSIILVNNDNFLIAEYAINKIEEAPKETYSVDDYIIKEFNNNNSFKI